MAGKRKQQQIEKTAQETFGYDHLRPGQAHVIQAVLDGHDALAVMPTGSGKSAIYQIAALQLPGATVVIYPLIALQRDQLEAIEKHHIAAAAQVNSAIPQIERQAALEKLQRKKLEFLFLAPEQFSNQEVLAKIKAANPPYLLLTKPIVWANGGMISALTTCG